MLKMMIDGGYMQVTMSRLEVADELTEAKG